MNETAVLPQPLAVPSKWDIIPIHSSDMAAYKRCRRYWDWTSPARNNLRRRVDIHGVKMELWFGTGIHYALEMYYDPILQRDPVESFMTWYEFQWNGGLVGEQWLERVYDIHPQVVDGTFKELDTLAGGEATHKEVKMYRVRGLRDLLPNVQLVEEEFEMHRQLGIGMMEFYREWAPKNDDFVTVAAESTFSIPLGLEAIDLREDSPHFGEKLEVHARGKRDAIIYYPEQDRYGLNDHKSAARIDEDYFLKLDKDEQCSNYLWASQMEGELYNVPWSGRLIDRILYTALRKNYPKPPTPTYGGTALSVDRQKEGTTAELFSAAVRESEVLSKWFTSNKKAQEYYTYLCESGDDMFIQRDLVTRNPAEIISTGNHIRMIAEEMLNPNTHIYPNPTGNWLCLHCAFRSPCLAADDGSDWKGMLSDGYEKNRER